MGRLSPALSEAIRLLWRSPKFAAAVPLLGMLAAGGAEAQARPWTLDLTASIPVAVTNELRTVDPHAVAERHHAFSAALNWRLAYLPPVSRASDVGVGVTAGFGEGGASVGAVVLYRRDIASSTDLGLSLGYLNAIIDGWSQRRGHGIQADARVFGPLPVGAGLSYQRIWTGADSGTAFDGMMEDAEALSLGLVLRQRPALYGTAVVGVTAALYVLSFRLLVDADY